MKKISTADKILSAMYDLSGGTTKPLKYEDIVVAAWKKYPQDFCLRGYDYPDSSDIHKPIYGPLKSRGFVRTANKFFSITEHGLTYIKNLSQPDFASEATDIRERLGRDEQQEVERILQSDAFAIFERGEKEKILDSDLYSFYGVTVRTGRNEFLGRVASVETAIKNAINIHTNNPQFKILSQLVEYMRNEDKFKTIFPTK